MGPPTAKRQQKSGVSPCYKGTGKWLKRQTDSRFVRKQTKRILKKCYKFVSASLLAFSRIFCTRRDNLLQATAP
ncbi:hypothetical protein CISIN_1g035109mg [Citrus sinensis]|uniref:Uncharacterized protein n=1 Tax=Citrus sinensis TaxID=2711 RepID=A0A067DBF7_CITSI|nr:hypothetical protein CISIN_1g035109mg [Citrus sinensis]